MRHVLHPKEVFLTLVMDLAKPLILLLSHFKEYSRQLGKPRAVGGSVPVCDYLQGGSISTPRLLEG